MSRLLALLFRTVGAVSRYSALDQYAMGLRSPSEVPPMFVITKPMSGSAEAEPKIGVEIRGTRKDVRITDIVAAMGTRVPAAASAPKVFRQAFVYVVSQSTRESSDELTKLERLRTAWETFFRDSTGGRGTMNARLR